jgi:RNA polymerase sigma-70 factor (ECF subfamily)
LDVELSLLMDNLFASENYGTYDYEVLSQTLNDVISVLPPRAKEVFLLRREKGLSNQEVASHLGVTVKAVEKQMTLCLKRIRRAFLDKGIPFIILLGLFLR